MNKTVAKYWARAMASRYLYAWVPYLRYVGLNGSLPRGAATGSSDIDLMVVAEPGHIFTVRFLMVGILALVGLKRTRTKVAGRICVNYFLTSDNLDIKPRNRKVAEAYKYTVALVDDCHCERERCNLNPMGLPRPFGPRNDNVVYHDILTQQNRWMEKYEAAISDDQKRFNQSVRVVGEPWVTVRSILEFLLLPVADALEIVLKYVQIKKIKNHPLTSINPDKIVVSDNELRFHPDK